MALIDVNGILQGEKLSTAVLQGLRRSLSGRLSEAAVRNVKEKISGQELERLPIAESEHPFVETGTQIAADIPLIALTALATGGLGAGPAVARALGPIASKIPLIKNVLSPAVLGRSAELGTAFAPIGALETALEEDRTPSDIVKGAAKSAATGAALGAIPLTSLGKALRRLRRPSVKRSPQRAFLPPPPVQEAPPPSEGPLTSPFSPSLPALPSPGRVIRTPFEFPRGERIIRTPFELPRGRRTIRTPFELPRRPVPISLPPPEIPNPELLRREEAERILKAGLKPTTKVAAEPQRAVTATTKETKVQRPKSLPVDVLVDRLQNLTGLSRKDLLDFVNAMLSRPPKEQNVMIKGLLRNPAIVRRIIEENRLRSAISNPSSLEQLEEEGLEF